MPSGGEHVEENLVGNIFGEMLKVTKGFGVGKILKPSINEIIILPIVQQMWHRSQQKCKRHEFPKTDDYGIFFVIN